MYASIKILSNKIKLYLKFHISLKTRSSLRVMQLDTTQSSRTATPGEILVIEEKWKYLKADKMTNWFQDLLWRGCGIHEQTGAQVNGRETGPCCTPNWSLKKKENSSAEKGFSTIKQDSWVSCGGKGYLHYLKTDHIHTCYTYNIII